MFWSICGVAGCLHAISSRFGNLATVITEMSVRDDTKNRSASVIDDTGPRSLSRRALLKKGVTAMPAVLTLQSGAALARTSNLISAAPRGTTDGLGRTLCLDTNSVEPALDSGHVYDLGAPPRADVNIISEREYRVFRRRRDFRADHDYDDDDDDDTSTPFRGRRRFRAEKIDESAMCERGGTFWYNDRDGTGWHRVELPRRGIVVSSGAMTSISDHVIDTLI